MLGLMHTLLGDFISERYGPARWLEVLVSAAIDPASPVLLLENTGCPFADGVYSGQVVI